MNGEIDVGDLTEEQLHAVIDLTRPERSRTALHAAVVELNERGVTFEAIAGRHDVHKTTAARWAQPAGQDRRRHRRKGEQK